MDIQPVETETITATLSAETGFGGSFTLPYPSGRNAADYAGNRAALRSNSRDVLYQSRGQISVVYGASDIAVTILAGGAYPLGETIYLDVDKGPRAAGSDKIAVPELAAPDKMDHAVMVKVDFGAPAAADADGVVASQAATAAGGLATGINGALAEDGVATFATPRNVVAAWTGTSVLTVTGTDEYGNVIVESSASGTSMTGAKAFKTVTGISVSADVTGLTVGSGVILGLPCFLAETGDVVVRKTNGAGLTTGTVVAGATEAATATTGDVRGTYSPGSAPNGTNTYDLLLAVRDPSYKGGAQYAG